MYNRDGEAEMNRNELNRALDFFTKGIAVKCNDDQLNAILYTNRATALFNLGKGSFLYTRVLNVLVLYDSQSERVRHNGLLRNRKTYLHILNILKNTYSIPRL